MAEYDREAIGRRIYERRTELGLRAIDLADLIGVSRVAVSQWERGVSVLGGDKLMNISEALKCSPEWIIAGIDRLEKIQDLNIEASDIKILRLAQQLPDTEKDNLIKMLEDKVEYYRKLYTELTQKLSPQK
ncbi:helix-turn-helix domain-containing protein [Arsenophonus nasoniae]|uniref:Helix-turn-helix domain-containing protein n=1 Tax=Arsenophonus nasoniae TaxID=638 RepID=D2TVN8_9GAMM|nr:helix-turn-helix domain-containing protein [Arsenophonus nasoniae]QBY44232.1 helix-turn-helix protein [Arsenophonus nasoniae]WGM04518.1 helix-turn-helix domain-containing protein [Arsenophonus nasoniae]WGM09626.1 helix-turn-helix domain-containing protein [Arsenophonus nasoniae]WGM14346.1 helix-turn-helix domain-containing protein [Arsenophonus nasoniae]CBA71418.1 phage transcriptional regulator [Arsenophonus nasoniae]